MAKEVLDQDDSGKLTVVILASYTSSLYSKLIRSMNLQIRPFLSKIKVIIYNHTHTTK